MIDIKCFYCDREASAKVGTAQGNILTALFGWLFGGTTWKKAERYVCRNHYETLTGEKA